MSVNRAIPNLLTMGNLFCGCLAVLAALKGNLLWASYLIVVAMMLDFLDGFAARLLNGASAIGRDLDSLADMVSFGVVPSLIMFRMLEIGRLRYFSSIRFDLNTFMHLDYVNAALLSLPFVFALAAAYRLARFNNTENKSHFEGLPTPMAALMVAALPVILLKQLNVGYVALPFDETVVTFHNLTHLSGFEISLSNLLLDTKVMMLVVLLISGLMVSRIKLLALKFDDFAWRKNAARYILLGLSLLLLIVFKALAVPLIAVVYIFISIFHFRWGTGKTASAIKQ